MSAVAGTSSARTGVSGAPSPRAVTALARVEVRRAVRSPVLLGGAVLAACTSWSAWWGGTEPAQDWSTQNYSQLFLGAAPLYLAAFLLANWAALREIEPTTEELLHTTAVPRWGRTLAVLLAGLVPASYGAVVALVEWLLVRRAGGITLGSASGALVVPPTLLEALHVPALALAFSCAGVAVARTIRSRAVGSLLGAFGTVMVLSYWLLAWFPAVLFSPTAAFLQGRRLGSELDPAEAARWTVVEPPGEYDPQWYGAERDLLLSAGHTTYLVGAAVLLGAYALWRSGRDRRTRWGLAVGVVLALAGISLQLVSFDGVRWLEPV